MKPTKFALASLIALGATVVAGSAFAQDLVVKIGHVAPTSGGIAHLGHGVGSGNALLLGQGCGDFGQCGHFNALVAAGQTAAVQP